MNIGRKLYFDLSTGNFILDTGEHSGQWVTPSTVEHDIDTFLELKKRDPSSFDVIELGYGQYSEDFRECGGRLKINLDKYAKLEKDKKHEAIEFSYPDANTPTDPPVFQKPLTTQIEQLRAENESLNLAVIDIYEIILG